MTGQTDQQLTEIWVTEDGRLRECTVGDGEGYALRAFGLAKVVRGPGLFSFTWDVEGIAPDAMLAVRKLLSEDCQLDQIDLRFNYGGWVEEAYDDRWLALDRVEQVMSYAGNRPPQDILIDKTPANDQATSRIVALRRLWQKREGCLSEDEVADFYSLYDHLLIFDDLRYHHIGGESLFWRVCGEDAAHDCMGRSYDYDPAQKTYSQTVCREYGDVLSRNSPTYDHICAPIEIRQERNWLLYQRLIAPFRLPDGRPILAVLCDRTQNLSIPFLRGEVH